MWIPKKAVSDFHRVAWALWLFHIVRDLSWDNGRRIRGRGKPPGQVGNQRFFGTIMMVPIVFRLGVLALSWNIWIERVECE